MRIISPLILGLFLLIQGGVKAQITVTSPTETFWGSDGDLELEIFVNVTCDSAEFWDNVTVKVTTPLSDVVLASTTAADVNAVSRIYTFTISSLFFEDAGVYIFSAEYDPGVGSAASDISFVTVNIYTIAFLNPQLFYYAVERTDILKISSYIRSDGDWNNVSVRLVSPTGASLAANSESTSLGSSWKYFEVDVIEIIAGTYKFMVTETLDGKAKTIEADALVELNVNNNVDEYLYRVQTDSDEFTSFVTDFYPYLYDGPDSTYILDGGNDMYDRGNYLTLTTSETGTLASIPFGKSYTYQSFEFSSVPTYPFTSLMWITNENGMEDYFELAVSSQTGVGTGEFSQSELQSFESGTYTITYATIQVFNLATDPSICEVYFHITNPTSVAPTNVTMNVAGSPPNGLDNSFSLSGPAKNLLVGYALLSRSNGDAVDDSSVQNVLTKLATLVQEKDVSSTISNGSSLVTPEQDSVTLTARMTAADWSTTTATIITPMAVETNLIDFTEEGSARIYSYTIDSVSAMDSGVYTFRTTDKYGFQVDSTTDLTVYTATLSTNQIEYTGQKGDAELTMSVFVTDKDWTDTRVMVIRPDGMIREATTLDTGNGQRTYTYTITNLFIADEGEYFFYTDYNGFTTSEKLKATVFLFTIDVYPEGFQAHIAGKENMAMFMIYGLCDGNWTNVNGQLISPSGSSHPMAVSDGLTSTIKAFYANITNAVAGSYEMILQEIQGSKGQATASAFHKIEYHNATLVDEYLYRISRDSELLVSYIPNWYNYWYDGSDHRHISDGGKDMYDGGNYVSASWASSGLVNTGGELVNQPYGQPYDNGIINFSSNNLYPYVAMMWVSNQAGTQEQFTMKVEGKTNSLIASGYETSRRILIEGTYTVTYTAFQVLKLSGPSICEVHFLITNSYYWNSVEPSSYNITVGGVVPQFLENSATIYGTPKNVMMGYTLLSSSTGESISYLNIELVLERFVSRIAEKDLFNISPVNEGATNAATLGGNGTVETLVTSSGQWEGVSVRVITPDGSQKPVTKYRYTNLNTQRIYEYEIVGVNASDKGRYEFTAIDAFGDEMTSSTTLELFTVTATVNTNSYVAEPGSEVTMYIEVSAETADITVTLTTPTQETVQLMQDVDSPGSLPGTATFSYTITNINYQRDNGEYNFTVTEQLGDQSFTITEPVSLEVFSVTIEAADTAYTVAVGEVAEISAFVYTESTDWDVSVSIQLPSETEVIVEEFIFTETGRRYTYPIREATVNDAGEYRFKATQMLGEDTYSVETSDIGLIVKVPGDTGNPTTTDKGLSGGAIAGIVIGSIAGAGLFLGLGVWIANSGSKSALSPSSGKTSNVYESDAAELGETKPSSEMKPEKQNDSDIDSPSQKRKESGSTSF